MQRLPALLLVGVLAELTLGCVSTTTRIETTHVEPLDRLPVGPPKGAGTVRVLAWQEDSAAFVRVQVVRHCPAAQELRVSRDEITKSRISGAAIAAGAALGGLGTVNALLSNGSGSSHTSDTTGLLMLGASAAVFVTALALTGEERKHLAPERRYQEEKPIPCSVEAWQGATVTLGAGPDSKEGTTGPKGELRFEGYSLPKRLVVSVNGLQVRDVGVVQNRQAAVRLSPGVSGAQPPTGIRRPAVAETPKPEPPRAELSKAEQPRQTPSAPLPNSPLPPPPAPPTAVPILPTGSLQELPPPPPPPK